jgi:hypothetical protein
MPLDSIRLSMCDELFDIPRVHLQPLKWTWMVSWHYLQPAPLKEGQY